MNYTNLDIEHKRAFLINLRILSIACILLAEAKGGTKEMWEEVMGENATQDIDNMSDTKIEEIIATIEKHQGSSVKGVVKIYKQ